MSAALDASRTATGSGTAPPWSAYRFHPGREWSKRVEHDHFGGGLPGGIKEVIQSLRRAEQITTGARVHQQILVGGGAHGAAHRRQARHKLRCGQFELADQNPARRGDVETGAVFTRRQRQRQIGHQQALAHLGLTADKQDAFRRQESRLDPSGRRRGRLLGE
jgi:hypothetical protein